MIDGSVLQSAQRCFEKKSRVVVKMVVRAISNDTKHVFQTLKPRLKLAKMCLKQGPQITEVNKVRKQSTIY